MTAQGAKYRAADAMADLLERLGADRVFCIPGESYLSLLDALHDHDGIDLVVARHEGGAGFMAVADAKITGRPGICLVSRGPGATNASIAVLTAKEDAVPLMLVIGQVSRSERGRGAFQEVDYAKTFSDVAKAVWDVTDGAKLVETVKAAWRVALSGTPGPVIVAVAEDAFEDLVEHADHKTEVTMLADPAPGAVASAAEFLSRSERPVLLAGGRVGSPEGREALARVAEKFQVPVVLTYKRQDLFDNDHPLFGGYLGFKIPRDQINLLAQADAVFAIGTRLGGTTTQNYTFPDIEGAKQALFHVYDDAQQIGRVFATDTGVVADPEQFLKRLADFDSNGGEPSDGRRAWPEKLSSYARGLTEWTPTERADGLEFGIAVQAIQKHADKDAVVVVDAGNFSSWVHRLWPFSSSQLMLGAVGGAMGLAMPGAVSAALRYPDRQIIVFVGDGGFMMTGAELSTAVSHNANVTVFVSKNGVYGTIRQHQELAFPGRVSGTGLGSVDFAKLAESYGAKGMRIETAADVEPVVEAALRHHGPCVVEVRTSVEAISAYMTIAQAHARSAKP